MEVLYHGIKTRYAYDFPLCFPHELIMSLRNIYTELAPKFTATASVAQSVERWSRHPVSQVQFPAGGLGVAFFATGPGWVFYIFLPLEFTLL